MGVTQGVVTQVGGMACLAARVVGRACGGRCSRDELWRALWAYGVASLPIAALTAAFSGAIMVLQAGLYIRQYGVYNLVGWFAGFSTLREMAPVLIGFIFSGRVGSHHTAELASMAVSDKLDALRVLNIDIYALWIVPRIIAMVIAMTGLVILGDAVALSAGAVCARVFMDVSLQTFVASLTSYLSFADVAVGVFKGTLFGATVGVVSSYFGLTPQPGAAGVGRAVHAQVVAAALGLVCVDCSVTAVGL